MADRHDNPELDRALDPEAEATAEERADAQRLGQTMDTLMSGRSALDDLPVPGDDDPLVEWVAVSQAVRGAGDVGELSAHRRDAVWGDIEGRLERASDAARGRARQRARARWRWLTGSLVAVAAVALAVFFIGRAMLPDGPPAVDVPDAPAAVANLDAREAQYAQRVMAPGADPLGDTRLRDYRRARFAAYRTDATHQRRFVVRSDR